jgi:hypothetical protein
MLCARVVRGAASSAEAGELRLRQTLQALGIERVEHAHQRRTRLGPGDLDGGRRADFQEHVAGPGTSLVGDLGTHGFVGCIGHAGTHASA